MRTEAEPVHSLEEYKQPCVQHSTSGCEKSEQRLLTPGNLSYAQMKLPEFSMP